MRPAVVRVLHRSATLSLLAVLVGVAAWVHMRVVDTHSVLDQRQAQIHAVHQMRRSCELGELPTVDQLAAAESLFPTETIVCTTIGDALFLTFANESRDALAANHR